MPEDAISAAHRIRHEAEVARKSANRSFDIANTYLGLDSLLKGAWGTESLNALGGGKSHIERAHAILEELLPRG